MADGRHFEKSKNCDLKNILTDFDEIWYANPYFEVTVHFSVLLWVTNVDIT